MVSFDNRSYSLFEKKFAAGYRFMKVERENGLHYSAHKLIWKILLKCIDKHNIQLFVTTHNLECLQSLEAVMQNNEKVQSLANIYNIAKTKQQGFQVYRYSFDGFKEAIENELGDFLRKSLCD